MTRAMPILSPPAVPVTIPFAPGTTKTLPAFPGHLRGPPGRQGARGFARRARRYRALAQLEQGFAVEVLDASPAPLNKVAQFAEHKAQGLISPYSTFQGSFADRSSKGSFLHELAAQLTDTRLPTEQQVRGERYGESEARKAAVARAKRPRGLIEQWAGQLQR